MGHLEESMSAPDPALQALVAEAREYIEAGDLDSGLKAFRRIAEANPQIPEVYNDLGAICAAMGEKDEAEVAFGRAAELTPTAANAWYNRGLMRFQSGNFLGAREDFHQASELAVEDAEIVNNLGVTCFQLQDFPAAREAFETAISLDIDYVSARLNLVDLTAAEGQLDLAIRDCRKLVEKSGDAEAHIKLIECSIALANQKLEDAAAVCEQAAENPDTDDELIRRTYGHIVRAVQILAGKASFSAED